MTITPSQLAEWARLAEAAASGPWVSTELTGESDTDLWGYLIEGPKYLVHHEHEFFYKKDSDFIAAARTAVPELVREVERLREALRVIQQMADDELSRHGMLPMSLVPQIEADARAALEVKV